MVRRAQRLPVLTIPKQFEIAAMRNDVIDGGRENGAPLLFAHDAKGKLGEKDFASCVPFGVVSALASAFPGELFESRLGLVRPSQRCTVDRLVSCVCVKSTVFCDLKGSHPTPHPREPFFFGSSACGGFYHSAATPGESA